ncbi:MAG: hypothetical protein AAB589_01280 [Patescibacteria group bacterium]
MNKSLISFFLVFALVLAPVFTVSAKSVNEKKSLLSRLLARFQRVEKVERVVLEPVVEINQPAINAESLSLVSSNPPSGAIRTGQPSNPDGTGFWDPKGAWQTIEVIMSGNTASVAPEMFEVKGTSADTPKVTGIMPSEKAGAVTLVLSHPIQVGWTTIVLKSSGQTINLGYLPGDVDQSGAFTAADWLKLIDALNGVADLPLYMTDIDNSGVFTPADLLRLIDMINGADHFVALNLFGASIPALPEVSLN